MRLRPFVLSLLLGTTSALVLAGCSGKPENSPVIRKKFAEVDKMQESITILVADNASLQEQVRRLTQENSDLRTFLPDSDGTPILEKLTAIETRLSRVETSTGDRMVSQAAVSSSASPAAAKPSNLDSEETRLAGTKATKVVATQQEQTAPAAAEHKSASPKAVAAANSFKEKTKATAPAAPAAPSTPSRKGAYYVIESGDTLDTIAKKHGVSIAEIVKANRLPSDKIRLARGQKIYVPGN